MKDSAVPGIFQLLERSGDVDVRCCDDASPSPSDETVAAAAVIAAFLRVICRVRVLARRREILPCLLAVAADVVAGALMAFLLLLPMPLPLPLLLCVGAQLDLFRELEEGVGAEVVVGGTKGCCCACELVS